VVSVKVATVLFTGLTDPVISGEHAFSPYRKTLSTSCKMIGMTYSAFPIRGILSVILMAMNKSRYPAVASIKMVNPNLDCFSTSTLANVLTLFCGDSFRKALIVCRLGAAFAQPYTLIVYSHKTGIIGTKDRGIVVWKILWNPTTRMSMPVFDDNGQTTTTLTDMLSGFFRNKSQFVLA
jgi:hypothetical protein